MNEKETVSPAQDIIQINKHLRGKFDYGTEDLIKSIDGANSRCSLNELLLDQIIAEKILDNVNRAIGSKPIKSYDDLYKPLTLKKKSRTCRLS